MEKQTRVVVAEHVDAKPCAQAKVEGGHLANVDRIPVGEQQRELATGGVVAGLHVHAGNFVATRGAREEHVYFREFH